MTMIPRSGGQIADLSKKFDKLNPKAIVSNQGGRSSAAIRKPPGYVPVVTNKSGLKHQ